MAGAMITVDVDSKQVDDALARLEQKLGDMKPVLQDIGEHLHISTGQRFRAQVDPNGTPWAPLSPVTLAKKKGPRILRESGMLQDTLRYQISDNELLFGTDRPYGAVHQFGQKKGASGKNRRGQPIPWGDIPARPYLGLSGEDETEILAIAHDWLMDDE